MFKIPFCMTWIVMWHDKCQGFMQDNIFASHSFLVDMWMLTYIHTNKPIKMCFRAWSKLLTHVWQSFTPIFKAYLWFYDRFVASFFTSGFTHPNDGWPKWWVAQMMGGPNDGWPKWWVAHMTGGPNDGQLGLCKCNLTLTVLDNMYGRP